MNFQSISGKKIDPSTKKWYLSSSLLPFTKNIFREVIKRQNLNKYGASFNATFLSLLVLHLTLKKTEGWI